jgi:hypothetical protein
MHIKLKEKMAFSVIVYGCGRWVIGENNFVE